jgi:hypothetical protein
MSIRGGKHVPLELVGPLALSTRKVYNLAELRSLLTKWSEDDLHQVPNAYVNIVNDEGVSVQLRLTERKLTDGSLVYDIVIR